MEELIKTLREKLYSKKAPGEVLNNITEKKLKEISRGVNYDSDALWVGAYLADMFISEAKETGDITKHLPMALDYAKKLIIKHSIPVSQAGIILEVIETHHGGEQKHIESKLYKNADCFKFLDPRGVFHIFAAYYENEDEKSFKTAIEYAMFKVEEKYNLVDLNEKLKGEARELYEMWQWFFKRMGYKPQTPKLYK